MSAQDGGPAFPQATHIDVEADVRYWEDAKVNGVTDGDGSLIPGREGDIWKIRMNLAEGRLENWPAGIVADIYYKVCDQGDYWLSDAAGERIAKWRGYYVPDDFLCHGDRGYGDYIIMKVNAGGVIDGYTRPAICAEGWVSVPPQSPTP